MGFLSTLKSIVTTPFKIADTLSKTTIGAMIPVVGQYSAVKGAVTDIVTGIKSALPPPVKKAPVPSLGMEMIAAKKLSNVVISKPTPKPAPSKPATKKVTAMTAVPVTKTLSIVPVKPAEKPTAKVLSNLTVPSKIKTEEIAVPAGAGIGVIALL